MKKLFFALLLITVVHAQDIDNDGLPNDWETTYSLDPNSAADALVDSNGNGVVNLVEYAFGGNPRIADPNIFPKGSIEANRFAITFRRRSNARFSIQPERADTLGARWSKQGFTLSSQRTLGADLQEVTYTLPQTSQQYVRVAVQLLPLQPSLPRFDYGVINQQYVHGQGITPVDIDRDNDIDLICSFSLTDAIYVLLNDGTGSGWNPTVVAPPTTIVAMQTAVADFDGDGDLDIVGVELFDRDCVFCAAGKVVWYEHPAAIAGTWTRREVASSFWGGRYVSTADLTGDGLPDIIASANEINGNGNGVFWFRNAANATSWSAAIPIDAGLLQAEVSRIQDVDGNGVPDVVALGKNSNQIAWYENNRTPGTINNAPTFTKHIIGTPTAPDNFVFANIDDDAALELIVTSASGISIYNQSADIRQPWAATPLDSNFGSGNNSRPFAADFDGDARIDVAVGSGSVGEVRWYQNTPTAWVPRTIQTGYNGLTELTGADLNRDGRMDLLSSTYNFGDTDRIAAYFNVSSDQGNRAPVLNPIGNRTARVGSQLRFTATASDVDGNTLGFSLNPNAPSGAAIDPITGVFTWTPTATGTFDCSIIVYDQVTSDEETFQIEVGEAGAPSPILLHVTFNDQSSVTAPAIGIGGGTTVPPANFVPGRTNNAATFTNGRFAIFPSVQNERKNIDFAKGEIEFWFRPNYSSTGDDSQHSILVVGDNYGAPRIEISESDRLRFFLLNRDFASFGVQSEYHEPLLENGVWAHIRAVWDTGSADSVQLYVNDVRVSSSVVPGGWSLSFENASSSIYVGAANTSGEFPADGLIDELIIR